MWIEFIPLSGRRWGQHHPRGIVALGTVDLGLEVAEPEVSAPARRWRRVVLQFRRLRFKQRCWGLLGGVLQGYPASLRDRVRAIL